ncbi:hypothetical protein C791_0536 [Amycolatopsis azurea DSM 43854]|uniref:Uncharacterized protein n=1 Tax=Amycolatopsis azurea DSM 43854 TaxID=1238180 RepID=M2NIV3_9PSEU|nr:hypothetical protein C791_0536 [Amycolatopsis azurea DSM 43854]
MQQQDRRPGAGDGHVGSDAVGGDPPERRDYGHDASKLVTIGYLETLGNFDRAAKTAPSPQVVSSR